MVRKSLILLLILLLPGVVGGQVHRTEQIEVELVAESRVAVAGETLWLGIRLKPAEHWHTYWKFGGDSGEATQARDWRLPAGVTAGDIVWPTPEWTPFLGSELVTFTYPREVILPLPLYIPADFEGTALSGGTATDGPVIDIATTIDWQVCEEICIPGSADFSLTLPLAAGADMDPRWQAGFAASRGDTPLPLDGHDLTARFNDHDGKINVMVQGPPGVFTDAEDAWFFPTARRIMHYAPYRDVLLEDGRIQISTSQHRRYDPTTIEEINGTLAVRNKDGSRIAYDIRPRRTAAAWDHSIEVELISESVALVPGQTAWLGLRLDPAEHWHTYWKMGGDSGEPSSLNEWQIPAGSATGDIQWPAPHWLPFYNTGLINFGYEEEVTLPLAFTLPADYRGDSVTLSALAFWNVCEQICIPGEQRLDITLPVTGDGTETDPRHAARFAAARSALPVTDHGIESLLAMAGERVSLGFEAEDDDLFATVEDAWFFPDRRRIIKPGPLRDVTVQPGYIQITHQQPRRMVEDPQVYGVLVTEDGAGARRAYEFLDPARDVGLTAAAVTAAATGTGGSGAGAGGLPLYLLFALLGGLILNLMPCVFPVLSIKALSLAKSAGETVRRQRLDGLAYTAGVILAFLALAALLIALRAGGERIGWAFQFQHPWFLAFIVYLFFMMGLSLSGVFEIGTGMMGVGGGLTQRRGYQGSFFTGVLATTVATPCTAPFMGPALGFALTQPWFTALAVFFALGFGMALPILLLSFLPVLSRYMPRPGPWMETFKQLLAFPLYASALFFLWVLGNQVGVMGMSLVLSACVLLAFAAWLYQRRLTMGALMRGAMAMVMLVALGSAAYVTQTPFMQILAVQTGGDSAAGATASGDGAGDGTASGDDYEPFSSARVDELRAAGRPVFVNMTAAWCITCLANEQTSLSTSRVKQAMQDNDITYMKGDWTNEDPAITEVLEAFNRPSVPLYILYPPDPTSEPIILPQILTPGIVVAAFESLSD